MLNIVARQDTRTDWLEQEQESVETELRPGASRRGAETTTTRTRTLLHEWSDSNWQTCSPGLFIRLQLVSFAVWEGILGAAGYWPALQSHSDMAKQAQQLFFSSLISTSIWDAETGCDQKKKKGCFITTFNTQYNIIELRAGTTFFFSTILTVHHTLTIRLSTNLTYPMKYQLHSVQVLWVWVGLKALTQATGVLKLMWQI